MYSCAGEAPQTVISKYYLEKEYNMKRLLLGLLFVAPAMVAMDVPKPVELSEKQKATIMSGLFESAMDPEAKQAISDKLLNKEALSEKDLALLEAYNLLPKPEGPMSFDDLITRFIDVQALGMGIAGCSLSATGIKQPKKTEILKVVIKALLIEDLEVDIRGHKGTLGEFFDQKILKKALKTIIAEHAEGKIDEDSLIDYHLRIKRSMKMDAFAKVLSSEDYKKLILPDRKVNIAYLLSLFGFIEKDFHDLDGLNVVINRLLMNQDIENHYILNCINFAVILKGLGCKEEELPDIDGLRSLISQVISWMTEKDGQTFNTFLRREGDHWRRTTKGTDSDQVAQDEAFARKLQSDDINNSNN